jgi:hypothetical protein
MKNIYKLYNHHDIPWVNLIWQAYYNYRNTPYGCQSKGSFWCRDCLTHLNQFRDLTTCSVGNSKIITLWKDPWNGEVLEDSYPHIHSYLKNEYITVEQVLNDDSLYDQFHLPLSMIAYQEFQDLQDDLNDITLTQEHDT